MADAEAAQLVDYLYTEETWAEFAKALKVAEEILSDTDNTTQKEVDNARTAFLNVRAGLRYIVHKAPVIEGYTLVTSISNNTESSSVSENIADNISVSGNYYIRGKGGYYLKLNNK